MFFWFNGGRSHFGLDKNLLSEVIGVDSRGLSFARLTRTQNCGTVANQTE
jgi:hypothetical protein